MESASPGISWAAWIAPLGVGRSAWRGTGTWSAACGQGACPSRWRLPPGSRSSGWPTRRLEARPTTTTGSITSASWTTRRGSRQSRAWATCTAGSEPGTLTSSSLPCSAAGRGGRPRFQAFWPAGSWRPCCWSTSPRASFVRAASTGQARSPRMALLLVPAMILTIGGGAGLSAQQPEHRPRDVRARRGRRPLRCGVRRTRLHGDTRAGRHGVAGCRGCDETPLLASDAGCGGSNRDRQGAIVTVRDGRRRGSCRCLPLRPRDRLDRATDRAERLPAVPAHDRGTAGQLAHARGRRSPHERGGERLGALAGPGDRIRCLPRGTGSAIGCTTARRTSTRPPRSCS